MPAMTAERREKLIQAQVLFTEGRSTKQVADALGVPRSTVKNWRVRWVEEGGGVPAAQPLLDDNREGEADTVDVVAYWAAEVRYLSQARDAAVAGRQGSMVGSLGQQLLQARKQYDAALKATEAERALAERAERAEPLELAERIGQALPVLARLVDRAVVEGWIVELKKVLGERG